MDKANKSKVMFVYLNTFLMFTCVLILSISLVYFVVKNSANENRTKAIESCTSSVLRLQRQIDQSFSSVYAISALIEEDKGLISFRKVASNMMPYFHGIDSLQIAPQAIVSDIVPLEGNEKAIGHDLLNDPKRVVAVRLAIDSK